MEDIKQILVVSMSTEECKKAFHYAVSLARMFGARLSILHIDYEMLRHWAGFGVSQLMDWENEFRAMKKKTRSDIKEMIQAEKAGGMKIREMVKDGEPVQEVMKVVTAKKIDLVIMAAHGEGRVEHLIYGRTNHEIVRTMPCSIFLVKGEPVKK